MKILQLCKKFPYPLKDGEAIAITHLSRALRELGCEITLLCMNTKKHYFDISELPDDFDHYKAIHYTDLDNKLKLKDAVLNLFSQESYHISRFKSDAFSEFLGNLLTDNEYDVIQLETLYLAPYIPVIRKHSDAIIAMRAHNVEHEIWERITTNSKFWPKKWYLSYLTRKLKRFEIEQLHQYDLLVPITKRDLIIFKKLGFNKKAIVTPIGIDGRDYEAQRFSGTEELSLSFIGALDWMPNIEGLEWFLNNVWVKVISRFPQLTLHIAGRNTPSWLRKMNLKNVFVYGEIPDAVEFINAHPVMIVPLLSGSGMRAKILEGMALSKVILTSSLGLEGINARHKKEVLIADTTSAFLDNINFCIQHRPQLLSIGEKARDFVAHQYDNLRIAKDLLNGYKSLTINRTKKMKVW